MKKRRKQDKEKLTSANLIILILNLATAIANLVGAIINMILIVR